jgi:SAM-dependent methyltransferase
VFDRSAEIYDAVYAFKDYAHEAQRLHELIGARSPEASSLLDVACGTGKHLEELRRWYEVEGLDIDRDLVAIARDRLDGVRVHEADMVSFDLERHFDVVVCLFSSIGYVGDIDHLHQAVVSMARHLAPQGLLVIEPWLSPDVWNTDRSDLLTVDQPDLKIARMNYCDRDGNMSILEFEYLVGTPRGVTHFTERHEIGLFSEAEYRQAFEAAGLAVEHDPEGLMGRGLYLATPA